MNRFLARILATAISLVGSLHAFSAEPGWAGEYTDKNLLNGKAVFQMSIEQSGSAMQVAFDAINNDGQGAAPEGVGPAKVSSKGALEFKWQDNLKNSGTGTITRSPDGVIVSMKTTHVADPRCLAFYGQNMHLKRVGKK